MVSRGDDTLVLWPQYFDVKLSRAEGRRVPKDLAVKKPDAKWVAAAAKKAKLRPELDEDARHPSVPYKRGGRVLIVKRIPKEEAIKEVAKAMVESQNE